MHEVAQSLASLELDPFEARDPAVAAAIRSARAIAVGNVGAVQLLAATSLAVKGETFKVQAANAQLSNLTIAEQTKDVRAVLLDALRKLGISTSSRSASSATGSTIERLASQLAAAQPSAPVLLHHPDIAAAVLLSGALADGDPNASAELAAKVQAISALSDAAEVQDKWQVMHELDGKSLGDTNFAKEVKDSLLHAIRQAGIFEHLTGAQLRSASVKELAKIVHDSHLEQFDKLDSATRSAMRHAAQLAKGDVKAAKELVAHMRVMAERKAASLTRELLIAQSDVHKMAPLDRIARPRRASSRYWPTRARA